MAKTSGLGDNLYVGGNNISGDIASLSKIGSSQAMLDFTDITKSAMARQGGLRDGAIEFTSYFDTATGLAHPTLSALPTSDVIVSYFRGSTQGNPAASMVGKQLDYNPTRANDGALTLNTSAQANAYGLEWGVMLTAGVQTDTSAGNSTALDQTAGTSNGAQAYLHVFSVTGTSCTVAIKHSTDNSSYTSLIAFTAATGATSERKAVTSTVNRYLRITTTGTFTSCLFAVTFVRNKTAVTF